jgi:hypothetical protein
MNNSLEEKIEVIEQKIDAIYRSVEKTRRYFQVMVWVSIAFVVLPAVGLLFIVPLFISRYLSSFNGVL